MTTLEDAIKLAHSSVYRTNDDSVVLDRSSKFAARRRANGAENYGPGIAVVSKGERLNKVGNGFFDAEPNSEARFWKAKFEELQQLQMEAETDLANQVKVHKEREAGLENYVSLLQQKVSQLENSGAKGSTGGADNVLSFYELMTGMSVKAEGNAYTCTLKNTIERKTTRFVINEGRNDDLDFVPTTNTDMLPDFLQGEITFEKNQAPAMLAGALMHLYDGEDGETSAMDEA